MERGVKGDVVVFDNEDLEPEDGVCGVGEPERLITELAIDAGLCKIIARVENDIPRREVG